MEYRTRLFYRLGITLLGLVALALVGLVISKPLAAHSGNWSQYQWLEASAANGDEWARDKLAEVKNLQATKGEALPPREDAVAKADVINGARVTVKGREPFYLEIENLPEFQSIDAVYAYVAQRKAALAQLASKNSEREVEVSISPQEHLPLSQMWRLKDANKLDVDQMTVDLFLNGKWHSVMFVGDPKERGEKPYINFNEPADKVEARIKQLMPPPAPATKLLLDSPGLELRISWVRGKLRAADALRLDSDPSILAVDPITDLLDAYNGRAVDIMVTNVPHLLVTKSRLAGQVYPVSETKPALSTEQPTPSPSRR